MRRTRIANAAAIALIMMSSACGGSTDSEEISAHREVDTSGVLKFGSPFPPPGVHLDPSQSSGITDGIWMAPVYGTLLRQFDSGVIEPYMADAVEVVDPYTVKIALRPDVTFTDGSAYDAAAVSTSLLRARTPDTPLAKAMLEPAIKTLERVEVIDPLTAVARLGAPLAGQFVVELSERPGMIQSPKQIAENPGQIDSKPIGAGPFTLISVTPQQLTYTKNPDYWDAANIKLGGLEIINTPQGVQQANGLLSGNLDWASYVPVDSALRIENDGRFEISVSQISNVQLVMCTGKAPFDNADFRQAVQQSIDRERFADVVYQGFTDPAYSFFREGNDRFSPTVQNFAKYDPESAKKLLAAAGVAPNFDLYYQGNFGQGRDAEVLQAQLNDTGVTAELVNERDLLAGFITPQKPGATLIPLVGAPGYGSFNKAFGPGGGHALCGTSRPDVMDAVSVAASLSPDDPEAIAAYQRAQDIVAENAYSIPIVAYPQISGWSSSKVAGTPTFNAQGHPQFDSVYIGK